MEVLFVCWAGLASLLQFERDRSSAQVRAAIEPCRPPVPSSRLLFLDCDRCLRVCCTRQAKLRAGLDGCSCCGCEGVGGARGAVRTTSLDSIRSCCTSSIAARGLKRESVGARRDDERDCSDVAARGTVGRATVTTRSVKQGDTSTHEEHARGAAGRERASHFEAETIAESQYQRIRAAAGQQQANEST